MLVRTFTLALMFALLSTAAVKKAKSLPGKSADESAEVTASVILDRESIKEALGSDLNGNFVVVDVRVTPKNGKLDIRRDDFLLRTDRDGERAHPFSPSQIAGRGALVVSQTGGRGGIMGDSAGPVWGGYPGGGRPQRMGGDGGGIGNTSEVSNEARVTSGAKDKESPLMKSLSEKVLPEKQTEEPVSGLLYFPMEPKQKLKDLELIYTTPSGKLNVRFR